MAALWGDNLNTDLHRLSTAFHTAKQHHLALLIPPHPIFTQSLSVENWQSNSKPEPIDQPIQLNLKQSVDLGRYVSTLQALLPEPSISNKLHNSANELVIYINNESNHTYPKLNNPPPPLSYYRYVIETRYWKKITLISYCDKNDPIVNHLIHHYPRIKHKKLTTSGATWQHLITASNLIVGADLFGQASSLVHQQNKRVWVPEYASKQLQEQANTKNKYASIYPIGITDYIYSEPIGAVWLKTLEQQHVQLNHDPVHISDDTRWLFTETEKCRSFEYCQSCRDTSSVGTLWRKVITQRFDVPKLDWDCPHGWNWGGKPNFKLKIKRWLGLGTIIKTTTSAMGVKPCADCQQRGEKLDGKRA